MVNFGNFSIFFVLVNFTASEESSAFTTEQELFNYLQKWTLSVKEEDYLKSQSRFARQFMNVSVDPCQDFYEFACGNFQSALPCDAAGRYGDSFDVIGSFSSHLIQQAITGGMRQYRSYEFVDNLFQSCMNDNAWDPKSNGRFLKEFAYWPFLRTDWKNNFHLEKATAKASSYGFEIFFNHEIDESDGRVTHFLDASFQSEADLDELLTISASIGVDLENKKGNLYKTIVFAVDLYDLAKEYTNDTGANYYTFNELENLSPNFDFRDYFTEFNTHVQRPTGSFYIYVKNPQYLRRVSKLIADTDEEIVANFVFAKILRALDPLPASTIFGWKRQEGCVKMMESYLNPFLMQWLSADKYVQRSEQQRVDSLTKTIQNYVYKHFKEELKNVSSKIKHSALSQIFNMKMDTFYPLTGNVVSLLNSRIEFSSGDFYGNYLKLMKFQKQLLLRNVDVNYVTKNKFSDFPRGSGIRVPVSLLLPPFYHHFAPDYVKYGALGTFIAQQFTMEMNTHSVLGCLHTSSFSEDMYNQTDIYQFCALKDGVEFALTAYKNHTDYNPIQTSNLPKKTNYLEPTDLKINGLIMDGIRGFYLSYAQTMCAKKDKISDIVRLQLFWGSPDFKTAFSCPSAA